MGRLMRVLVLLALLAGAAVAALALDLERTLGQPIGAGDEDLFVVERGQSWDAVIEALGRRLDLAPRAVLYLRVHGRLTGQALQIQAGEYRLRPDDTLRRLVERFVAGDVRLYPLTVVEGWRFSQALAAVRAHPKLRQVLPDDPAAIMSALGAEGLHPEGRFLPETYRFAAGDTDLDFLRRARQAMSDRLERVWASRQPDLPLESPDELLVLASIIERETGAETERAQVAGVFVRRLRRGMRLQTDPTVIYGLGDAFDGNLRRRDLRRDTPYNTYTRHGLPPTPICLPGERSLRAAADPADGDALFFVSRGDGTHQFSATLEEHNRAVRRFQLGQGS